MRPPLAARRLVPLLLGLAACEVPREDGQLARAVAQEIGETLHEHAYASTADFSRWNELLAPLAPRLARAESDDDIAAVLQEALEGFGVSHLSILTPREVAEREAGTRTGSGLVAQPLPEGYLVCAVSEGGPAAQAGLVPGDLITEVDGRPPAAGALSGEAGQQHTLRWLSGDTPREGTLVLREHRRVSPDRLGFLPDGTALVAIHSFSDSLYDRVLVASLFDRAHDAPALILDLRSNKGGNAANVEHLITQVATLATATCVDIYREDADATREATGRAPTPAEIVAHVAPNGRSVSEPPDDAPYAGPLAVLVDSQCGSGGELTPFTLQRLGRAVLVGSPTPGKVLIGANFELEGGFELQAPIGEFVASDGATLEGRGVKPDVELAPRDTARHEIVVEAARRALGR